MIQLTILLFSALRESLGAGSLQMTLPATATGRTLLDRMESDFPALKEFRPVIRLAVNQDYVGEDVALQDGDEVALITPVSGG